MAENYWPSEVSWATGWYRRKRHICESQVALADGSVRAICSLYTHVYPNGRTRAKYPIPMADSPEVMALPACKTCLRLLGKGDTGASS